MSIERAIIDELEEQIDELEDQNYALEDELLELRGPVPEFPVGIVSTKMYVKKFNEMRHFK